MVEQVGVGHLSVSADTSVDPGSAPSRLRLSTPLSTYEESRQHLTSFGSNEILHGGAGGSRTHIAGFSDRCLDHLGYRSTLQTNFEIISEDQRIYNICDCGGSCLC